MENVSEKRKGNLKMSFLEIMIGILSGVESTIGTWPLNREGIGERFKGVV